MSWERGRADVEALLRNEELAHVTPSLKLGERMLEEAARHLSSAPR
jgi:hypothetical protein